MNDLVDKKKNGLSEPAEQGTTLFHYAAQQTKAKLANLEGEIIKWRKMKKWPLVIEAVDAKIAEQQSFIEFWDKWVIPRAIYNTLGSSKSSAERMSIQQAHDLLGFNQQTVSRWRKWLRDVDTYREKLIFGALRLVGTEPNENHRANGTGENEWFTPPAYIEAAREVMGGIDLDPASHPEAQKVVQAAQYFTREQDGLGEDWFGRVWLNPPYAQPDIALFVHKLVEEVKWNRIEQAILLTHNYTDTEWFHEAESMAALICFTRGRINFVKLDGTLANPTQGQAIFYYGKNTEQFGYVFQNFGFIR